MGWSRPLVTLIIAPKDWYAHAEEQLTTSLEHSDVAEVLYLLSPPVPETLTAALDAACRAHSHLRVLRMGELENPYAMRQAAMEQVTHLTFYFVSLDLTSLHLT